MTISASAADPAAASALALRPLGVRLSVPARLARLWRYRELLAGLVAKEVKVRYSNSVLGFAWSMANPAMYLLVFYIVFSRVLDSGLPDFTIYLLSGLLVWNLFATALTGAVTAITANAALVKKVDFPRDILPLAAVGTALFNFVLQTGVFLVVLAATRHGVDWAYVPLLVPALIALALFVAGLGLLMAAINVYVRDLQHGVELGLLAWFWFTPVVWYYGLVADLENGDWAKWLLLNPVACITLTFQRAIYGITDFRDAAGSHTILPSYSVLEHLLLVGAVGAAGAILFVIGEIVMSRLEGNFAEEL